MDTRIFCPLEWRGGFVVGLEKVFDGFHELFHASEARSLQGRTAQDAEPDLDLIEPRGMGRREMKVNMGMAFNPWVIGLEFMDTQIVQNEMDFLPRMTRRDRIEKRQEFLAPLSGKAFGFDLSGGHIQGCEKIGGSVALVFMGKASHRAAVGHFEPPLLPLEGLNAGLFIYGKNNRVGWRAKVEADDVGALGVKLRIGRNAPRVPSLQANTQEAQFLPDARRGNSQRLAQSASVPLGVSGWRLAVDLLEDALPKTLGILIPSFASHR